MPKHSRPLKHKSSPLERSWRVVDSYGGGLSRLVYLMWLSCSFRHCAFIRPHSTPHLRTLLTQASPLFSYWSFSAPSCNDLTHTNKLVPFPLMAHDFFTPQPISADVFLLRSILHNWPDRYSVSILRALTPAMRPGSRVLVQDSCLPDPGVIPCWKETGPRDMDLMMSAFFNAWERDGEEWKELFAKAEPRFEFVGITQSEGSALALVEARWTGGAKWTIDVIYVDTQQLLNIDTREDICLI
ncbi:S-adenosyl-L-methionine-dependent methyltransferase [Massariosphaeria phaeospora]|uniref:S-adenosyl-L-methionine-dependent methyltransferase n=1 Tax=Massariosphaeria phaeospora TaxID=100035 RepID=A0A7C8I4G8_9PLEO|nr:S-adenosyl-L-methionine-dependent methyltransferase [Massariosphaeria phaeospora]